MSRKLYHSARAFAFSLSLLAVGLIAAVSQVDQSSRSGTTPGVLAAVAAEAEQAQPTAQPNSRQRRRAQSREVLALPFFSFAQGLRDGNRS